MTSFYVQKCCHLVGAHGASAWRTCILRLSTVPDTRNILNCFFSKSENSQYSLQRNDSLCTFECDFCVWIFARKIITFCMNKIFADSRLWRDTRKLRADTSYYTGNYLLQFQKLTETCKIPCRTPTQKRLYIQDCGCFGYVTVCGIRLIPGSGRYVG